MSAPCESTQEAAGQDAKYPEILLAKIRAVVAQLETEAASKLSAKANPEFKLGQFTQRTFEVVAYDEVTRVATLNVDGLLPKLNIPEGGEQAHADRIAAQRLAAEQRAAHAEQVRARQAVALANKVAATKAARVEMMRAKSRFAQQRVVDGSVDSAAATAAAAALDAEVSAFAFTDDELAEIQLTADEIAALEKGIAAPPAPEFAENEAEDELFTLSAETKIEVHAAFLAAAIVRVNGIWSKFNAFQDQVDGGLFVTTGDFGKTLDIVYLHDAMSVKAENVKLASSVRIVQKVAAERSSTSACSVM